jgi:mono/diheme cytochrome c family protein
MLARASLSFLCGVACLWLVACKVEKPSGVETKVMQWTKHNLTVGGKHETNPVQPTKENIESGKHIFGYYCVVCHGRDGQGTGVPFAANMSPAIPSLASADIQRYNDGQLKWIIENGISPSGMPASRGTLNDDEMWHIVVYLRHLPPAGSLGEPRAYSAEEFEDSPPEPTH